MSRTTRDILQSILAAAWRRRYAICLPIAIMPFIGLTASYLAPKVYEAKMTVLVQEPARMNPFLNDLSIGTNVKERMPALTAMLRSEHVLGRVLTDLGEMPADADLMTRLRLINELGKSISVKLTGNELVELKITDRRRAGLGKKLELVGTNFIERLLSPQRGAVASSESFLTDQLKERRAALDRAELILADFRRRNSDKLPALLNVNVQRLASMTKLLEEKKMEVATADMVFDDLRQRLAGTNPVIGRIEEKIVQATSEVAGLRARYTDQHSSVLTAESRLARLKEERQAIVQATEKFRDMDVDALWNMVASASATPENAVTAPLLISQMERLQEARSRCTALRKDIEQLETAVAEMKTSIAQFSPIEQQLRRIERGVEAARELHDTLAKRSEMARLTGALGRYETPERIKIIDPPTEPTAPVTPGRLLFMIAGMIGGIVMGAGLAVALEFLDTTLRRTDSIAEISGLAVISTLDRIIPAAKATPTAPA